MVLPELADPTKRTFNCPIYNNDFKTNDNTCIIYEITIGDTIPEDFLYIFIHQRN